MCLICIELDKGRMNVREARAALSEARTGMPKEHIEEVQEKINAAETKRE